ncbi:protein BCL9 homolog [Cylas formicarius]|uniref:protein BCL9 homolog n=1 Tax=Cylas formicarius TaxID=197179 RepID=UPI0029587C12|nr:protein BCL9 homolog [Cylas formicarius]
MIKEKHEKGSDNSKEESVSADKESANVDVRIKKEDDVTVKKEPCAGPITKNGGIVGSTNTGSMQTATDHKAETHCEDAVNASGTDSNSLPLKQEDSIEADSLGDAFGLALGGQAASGGAGNHPPPIQPEGVQPLQSNVINKQPNSMEVQYMQQQSQIFVFSTMLANSGAEEVVQGRYASIIAYHCAQPGTKKYLEKNPLKITQFNRPNPAQWLNSLPMMKNKGCTRSPSLGPKPPTTIDNFLGPEGLEEMVGLGDPDAPWDQKNNHHLEGLDSAVSNGLPDMGPDMDSCSPSLSNIQPKLQGVQVPDENLTPLQRQRREEKLGTLRNLQQLLFLENQSNETGAGPSEGIPGIPPGGAPPGSGTGAPGQSPVTAQMEWQKLQHQFYEDRTKIKPQSQQGGTNTSCGSIVPIGPVSGASGPLPPSSSAAPTNTRGGQGMGPRLQGPPPPYHQTPRSASVPIALQSPNPTSPNNPTSNLSLPSPRASSALNSPADPNRAFGLTRHMSTGQSPTSQDSPSAPRLNHSNPSTPLSSHLSPSVTSSSTEPTSTHQSTVDGMFGRTLQSMAQQKQQMNTSTTSSCSTSLSAMGAGKEPNLMPVPSPQQIQYLNTFEGQELIIQKQPNTSLKEGNIISPPVLPTSLESGFPGNADLPHTRVSGPNTPTSMDVGPRFPPTPGVSSEGCRFQIPSPQTPTATTCGGDKPQRLSGPTTVAPGMSPQTVPGPNSDPLKTDLFPTPSPHMMDVPRFPGPNASPGAKMAGGFGVNVSPQGKPNPLDLPNYGCARGDNVPLNPNCTSSMPGNPKVSHFDPISSLAQMSQQLTNSVASSLNGQGNQGPPMMNFGSPSMHMMDIGGCHGMGDMDQGANNMMGLPMQGPPHGFHPNSPMGHMRSLSPKLSGAFPNHMPMPRMMGRPPGPNPYNGANVQVKPNAPNTIQYLPAKSQVGAAPGPRGPPSLDFLTRLATPMNMMENKMPAQNMQYFSNCGPNNGPMQGSPMGPHMGHMDGGPGLTQEGPMGPMGPMGGHIGNGAGPMMGGGMPMPGGMMPMMRGAPAGMRPMMRMPQMGFNGPPGGPGGPDPSMFNPNMGPTPSAAQMFVTGPKGSPMGMGAPDASQPLPPSMGQNNSFKNNSFVGPTTSDPNYAQQYHNFQQQLYATNTRSQMGGVAQAMGPGPGPPHMQQPPYFNPK